eukprot:295826-Chlamydomonas_euryale.AAC.1
MRVAASHGEVPSLVAATQLTCGSDTATGGCMAASQYGGRPDAVLPPDGGDAGPAVVGDGSGKVGNLPHGDGSGGVDSAVAAADAEGGVDATAANAL